MPSLTSREGETERHASSSDSHTSRELRPTTRTRCVDGVSTSHGRPVTCPLWQFPALLRARELHSMLSGPPSRACAHDSSRRRCITPSRQRVDLGRSFATGTVQLQVADIGRHISEWHATFAHNSLSSPLTNPTRARPPVPPSEYVRMTRLSPRKWAGNEMHEATRRLSGCNVPRIAVVATLSAEPSPHSTEALANDVARGGVDHYHCCFESKANDRICGC